MAVDYKWPEFQATRQDSSVIDNIPNVEGFEKFSQSQSNTSKETPKPTVQTAVFSELKPIQP